MERTLTFDGISSLQVGLIIDGYFSRGVASRRISRRSIPGHNGEFLIDEGSYDNLDEPYTVHWLAGATKQEDETNFRNIVAWLKQDGYYRLEDSDFPGCFWMARTSGIARRNVVNSRDCFFTAPLVFNRKPQCYLTSGEETVSVSSGDTLSNPTNEIAEPLISFYLTGEGTLTINGRINEFAGFTGTVTIDCEHQIIYQGNTNLSNNMTGDFPMLQSGTNTITFSEGISDLTIQPRWWTR